MSFVTKIRREKAAVQGVEVGGVYGKGQYISGFVLLLKIPAGFELGKGVFFILSLFDSSNSSTTRSKKEGKLDRATIVMIHTSFVLNDAFSQSQLPTRRAKDIL